MWVILGGWGVGHYIGRVGLDGTLFLGERV